MTQITRTCVECGGSDNKCEWTGDCYHPNMPDTCHPIEDDCEYGKCPSCTDGKQRGWKKCEWKDDKSKGILFDGGKVTEYTQCSSCKPDCQDGYIPVATDQEVDEWRK